MSYDKWYKTSQDIISQLKVSYLDTSKRPEQGMKVE